MTARARVSKSARLTIEDRSVGTRGGAAIARSLPDEIEVREARQHRLAPDRRVLERDRDLLIAPGELRGHHDPIAPSSMADAIAVAVLTLARDDRTWRSSRRRGRRWDAERS